MSTRSQVFAICDSQMCLRMPQILKFSCRMHPRLEIRSPRAIFSCSSARASWAWALAPRLSFTCCVAFMMAAIWPVWSACAWLADIHANYVAAWGLDARVLWHWSLFLLGGTPQASKSLFISIMLWGAPACMMMLHVWASCSYRFRHPSCRRVLRTPPHFPLLGKWVLQVVK